MRVSFSGFAWGFWLCVQALSVVVVAFALAGSVGTAAAQYYPPPPPPGYPPPYAQPGYSAVPLPPPGAIYDPRGDENDAPVGGPYVPYTPAPSGRFYPGLIANCCRSRRRLSKAFSGRWPTSPSVPVPKT